MQAVNYSDQYLTTLLRKTVIVIWKFKNRKKNNRNGKKQK
jgi:hypothetical protein